MPSKPWTQQELQQPLHKRRWKSIKLAPGGQHQRLDSAAIIPMRGPSAQLDDATRARALLSLLEPAIARDIATYSSDPKAQVSFAVGYLNQLAGKPILKQ